MYDNQDGTKVLTSKYVTASRAGGSYFTKK